jgi:hypothetical protein
LPSRREPIALPGGFGIAIGLMESLSSTALFDDGASYERGMGIWSRLVERQRPARP